MLLYILQAEDSPYNRTDNVSMVQGLEILVVVSQELMNDTALLQQGVAVQQGVACKS